MGDLACQGAAFAMPSRMAGKRFGNAAVQQPPPRQAGLFIHKRSQFLMTEVVGQIIGTGVMLCLYNQSLRAQSFQGRDGFDFAATARFAQDVEVEGAPDDSRRIEQLPANFIDRAQSRSEQVAYATGQ